MSDSHGSYVDSSSAAEQVEDYSEYMPPDITLQPPTQGKTKPKNTKKSNNKSARSKKVEKKEGHKYPAVLLLGGSAFVATKSQVLVDKILSSIEKRISSSSPLNLLGRTTKYYRIYYDPAAQGVTGIKSRMTKLMSTEHCYSTGDYESLELLLSPLVRGNWKAFRDIHIKQLATKSRLLQATYCSQWTFHLRALRKVTPTSWSKRHRVILMVLCIATRSMDLTNEMAEITARVVDADNTEEDYDNAEESMKGLKHACEWNLYGTKRGFAAKPQGCFAGPECSPEEDGDLIEQKLYCFKRANPDGIYGSKIQDREGEA